MGNAQRKREAAARHNRAREAHKVEPLFDYLARLGEGPGRQVPPHRSGGARPHGYNQVLAAGMAAALAAQPPRGRHGG